jgi:hypothetical protein
MDLQHADVRRAAVAGLIGTAAMTGLWQAEMQLGLARFAVGDILSNLLAVITAHTRLGSLMGWVLHFTAGILLALLYAAWAGPRRHLPVAWGLLYGAAIFLVAQLVFMPLVGAGLFSRGDPAMLIGSLVGHLVYGGLVGLIYGAPALGGVIALQRRHQAG